MSGGSFNYISIWADDASMLVERQSDLLSLAEELSTCYPDTEAAKDTEDLVKLLGHFLEEIERRGGHLRDVWHAVEWWVSGDYGKDSVQKAIDQYAADKLKARES